MHRLAPGLLGTALLAATAIALPSLSADAPKAPAAKAEAVAKEIDVALCLDVSGSMQGLIDAAKNKLWDIVNELAKAQPTPKLRVALYSYGHTTYDANKGWVRKELDLSADLDMLYQKLFALTINGGEEYVGRVCRDAIKEQPWAKDKNSLRLIFVAGNEPASQDPLVKLKDLAALAREMDIVINPIYCGGADDGDGRDWRELASMAHGRFANINHNKQVAIATPVDKDLAKLANELNSTYVAFGKDKWKGANQVAQTTNASKAGEGVLASRVATQNSAFYMCDDWCLVDRIKKDPKFDITKVKDEDLPDNMKKMKPEERVKYVKDMTEKRTNLNKKIADLTVQRDKFIRDELKRNPKAADQAFDAAVRETLRIQAGARGLQIKE